jgi:hypothetical protein
MKLWRIGAILVVGVVISACNSSTGAGGTSNPNSNGGGGPAVSTKAKTTLVVTGPGLPPNGYPYFAQVVCAKPNNAAISDITVLGNVLTDLTAPSVSVNAESGSLKVTFTKAANGELDQTVYKTSGMDVSSGHLHADTDLEKVSGTLLGPIHLKVDANC